MLLLRAQSIEAYSTVFTGKKGKTMTPSRNSYKQWRVIYPSDWQINQHSINPNTNPKTAFFKKKVDHDPDPTFSWHASRSFRNLSSGRLRFEGEQQPIALLVRNKMVIFKVVARSRVGIHTYAGTYSRNLELFVFNFEKAFLSLNRDDTNPNPKPE